MRTALSILALIISLSTFGQSWSPPGATWKYSYTTPSWVSGYVEIAYTGDTVINSQTVNKLQKTLYGYNHVTSQYFISAIGQELTYEQNGVVYLWFDNNWDTLYDFNASIGDTWRLAKQPLAYCDSNSTLTVLDTGSMLINTNSLRFVTVQFNYTDSTIRDTIIEKIGFIRSYMFPYDNCDAALDANEGGPLRCYQDDNFPSYKPNYANVCEYIVGQNELASDPRIKLAPNPIKDELRILTGYQLLSSYTICGIDGKLIQRGELTDHAIQLTELNAGIYFLTLFTPDNVAVWFRIIKQ